MRIFLFGASLVVGSLGLLSFPVAASVRVLGVDVPKRNICAAASTVKCVYSSYGMQSNFIGNDTKSVNFLQDGEPDVDEYLGRVYQRSMAKGQPFCQNRIQDPFRSYAKSINKPYFKIVLESTIDFEVETERLIGAGAKIDGVKIAKAAGVDPNQIENIAAAVELAYKNVRKEKVRILGKWRAYELNPELVSAMRAVDGPAELISCAQWLHKTKQSIVGGFTGYVLEDAEISDGLESNFAAALKASLGQGVDAEKMASITGEFQKKVKLRAKSKFTPNFELLAISRLS